MVRIFAWIIITVATGMLGVISVPLSGFVADVEDESVCNKCINTISCFARKRVFKDSNYLSEFMLLSFCKVRGFCRYAPVISKKILLNYVLGNTILVSILFWSKEYILTSVVFGVSAAMLLALSVVDWNTQYIPVEYTGIVFLCGLIHLFADFSNWLQYLIGLIAVSGFLFIVDHLAVPILGRRYSDGEEIDSVIGDGDIKLMAATGLLLGWKLNFIALGIGCITGSVIHLIRMKIKGSGTQLALGPYLSLGIYITMICGEQLVSWYLNMMGVRPL